jgi:hypothetical protein
VSWYLDHNIQTYTSDPKGVKKLDGQPSGDQGLFSFFGTGFTSEDFRSSINGYMFANGPMQRRPLTDSTEALWLGKTLSADEINNLITAIRRQLAIVPSHGTSHRTLARLHLSLLPHASEALAENLALRQQLARLKRGRDVPTFTRA